MDLKQTKLQPQSQIEVVIDSSLSSTVTTTATTKASIIRNHPSPSPSPSPILTRIHAGYFRISLSLCSQALLWKILAKPPMEESHAFRRVLFLMVPPAAFNFLWSLALFALILQSLLYLLRCLFHFELVEAEFTHRVGVNYLFAPWISWLLLLQSSPFLSPTSPSYQVLWWIFAVPVIFLDVKIYGQWFTKGKRFLSTVANPTSQLSVIGNLVASRAAAQMGCKESAVCMFSLGMTHYLVLFVTLYQRLSGSNNLPAMLRPVFFLFIGAPSMACLAWESISGKFDNTSKMLFFLSLFLFMSLVIIINQTITLLLFSVRFIYFKCTAIRIQNCTTKD